VSPDRPSKIMIGVVLASKLKNSHVIFNMNSTVPTWAIHMRVQISKWNWVQNFLSTKFFKLKPPKLWESHRFHLLGNGKEMVTLETHEAVAGVTPRPTSLNGQNSNGSLTFCSALMI
jgi:hypothetical protein